MTLPDLWKPYTPEEVRLRMQGFGLPWYVVGGWALDLWSGSQTRDHADLEICVLAEDLDQALSHLHPLNFYAAQAGGLTALETKGATTGASQFWGLDATVQAWRIDVMVERGGATTWVYKRDPAITLPRHMAILGSKRGLPFLVPEAVLLFKAKACRPKDQMDFERVLPKLDHGAREWLYHCLHTEDPTHTWLQRLRSS